MLKFEDIYETLVGERVPEAAVPGVESIASEGSAYSEAYQSVMEARMNLARRFGMDFEDEDLERIMNAIAVIEKRNRKGNVPIRRSAVCFRGRKLTRNDTKRSMKKRGVFRLLCHCEPVRRLVWQSPGIAHRFALQEQTLYREIATSLRSSQ